MSFWQMFWQAALCGLGAVGIFVEMVHRLAHSHSMIGRLAIVGLGGWIILALLTPLIEWRALSGETEIWAALLFGIIGIVLLTGEACHILHERHLNRLMYLVATVGCALVIGLILTKPKGYNLALLPPMTPSTTPYAVNARTFGPGPGPSRPPDPTPAATAAPTAAPTPSSRSAASAQVGFGTMDCSTMSFHQKKLVPRCQATTSP